MSSENCLKTVRSCDADVLEHLLARGLLARLELLFPLAHRCPPPVLGAVAAGVLADEPAELEPGELLGRVARDVLEGQPCLAVEPGVEARPQLYPTQS
jgi:hypothetical protein